MKRLEKKELNQKVEKGREKDDNKAIEIDENLLPKGWKSTSPKRIGAARLGPTRLGQAYEAYDDKREETLLPDGWNPLRPTQILVARKVLTQLGLPEGEKLKENLLPQ